VPYFELGRGWGKRVLHQTVDLTIVRRPKEATPIHELSAEWRVRTALRARLSVQAGPAGRFAADADLGQRSAIGKVVGRAVVRSQKPNNWLAKDSPSASRPEMNFEERSWISTIRWLPYALASGTTFPPVLGSQ
jgi:hypothetical protein